MVDSLKKISYAIDDYHYDLPSHLIAQVPSLKREESRLLVLDRNRKRIEHHTFTDFVWFLRKGDVLVLNDTKVVPARLHGMKETGGAVELLILDPYKTNDRQGSHEYHCLVRSSKRPKADSVIQLENGPKVRVLSDAPDGILKVVFLTSEPLLSVLERIGHVPLPPYISRNGAGEQIDDVQSYQTVYAQKPGAVAAPTAGLHFSPELLGKIAERGVEIARVTLHVGYGTFSPIRVRDIRCHSLHSEYVEVSQEAAARIEQAKREKRRVVAVGTTVVRVLEWIACKNGRIVPSQGQCDHYIYPGYRFRIVDCMVTNFHLPKSSLLLLVSAFAGREAILEAYEEAVREHYRFFSYGDAMLIL